MRRKLLVGGAVASAAFASGAAAAPTPDRRSDTEPRELGGKAMPDGQLPQPGGWNRFQIEVDDLASR